MIKLPHVLVIAERPDAIAELTAGAAGLAEKVTLVYSGAREAAVNAAAAYYAGTVESHSFLSYLPSIAALVRELRPQLVLTEATKNGRAAAAAAAAAAGTSVQTDAVSLSLVDGRVSTQRMVYGGAAFQTQSGLGETAVVCAAAGLFEAGEKQPAAQIFELEPHSAGVRLLERRTKEEKSVNLNAAKIVIGAGRGFGCAENLALARELAAVIGAEVGCSRPVAEEEKWMPKEAYIGVSGVMIKPELYIACGISGQVQHMTGVSQARTIVAVNKDSGAPIFEKCDYGIVGDLNTVLKALIQAFKK